MDAPQLSEEHVAMILKVSDTLSSMIDISAGHMRQLEAAGYSHEAAEQLALMVHAGLIGGLFSTAAQTAATADDPQQD